MCWTAAGGPHARQRDPSRSIDLAHAWLKRVLRTEGSAPFLGGVAQAYKALDTALSDLLETHGQAHTVGVHYTAFDGTSDLSAYDAVYLQANADWSGDMPVAGQRQLINWVNCGGGLVTVEWTTWKIGSGSFQLIDAIFPAARTTAYDSPSQETFTQVTPDATLNAGLPETFTFTTTNYSGSESNLNPRPGATIYYDSELDSGLLGWNFNLGRVASPRRAKTPPARGRGRDTRGDAGGGQCPSAFSSGALEDVRHHRGAGAAEGGE